jgi:hypothetical protein
MLGHRVTQQDRSSTTAAMLLDDEKHLQIPVRDSREPNRCAISNRHRDIDKLQIIISQSILIEIDIDGRQEIMRRLDRATPDPHKLAGILGVF